MKQIVVFAVTVAIAAGGALISTSQGQTNGYPEVDIGPKFDAAGQLMQPQGFRRWVFIGAPFTPNALNDGAAGFPEYHNVYVEPAAYSHYLEHGQWPEGTMMVKELQLSMPGTFEDGSRTESSGRGYFPSTPNGLDVSVKDSKRFADTNGWGFFNFGHHAPPYAAAAPVGASRSARRSRRTRRDG